MDDVSQDEGWACDGCGTTDAGHWDITRLEMYDYSIEEVGPTGIITKNGGVGYITAYRGNDGTYELRSTTKIGDPQIYQGHCTRAPPTSDDFSCSIPFSATGGKHVLTCVSWSLLRCMR